MWCVVCGVPGLPWSMEGGRAAAKARGKEETDRPRGRELDSSLTWTRRVTRARERERGVE